MSEISSGFSFDWLVRAAKIRRFEFAAIDDQQIRNRDVGTASEIRPDQIAEICILDSTPEPITPDQTKGDED